MSACEHCGQPIAEKRLKRHVNAVTCSKDCAIERSMAKHAARTNHFIKLSREAARQAKIAAAEPRDCVECGRGIAAERLVRHPRSHTCSKECSKARDNRLGRERHASMMQAWVESQRS